MASLTSQAFKGFLFQAAENVHQLRGLSKLRSVRIPISFTVEIEQPSVVPNYMTSLPVFELVAAEGSRTRNYELFDKPEHEVESFRLPNKTILSMDVNFN
jgi:hypothetical protein